MKVEQNILKYINSVVTTAKVAGIDNIIIEPGRVRALDDNNTVILLHTANVPDMPFGSIGLNRIDIFMARYALAQTADKFEMEAVVDGPDDNKYARSLTMKAKGVKIDFRCANPATIRAPRSLNDAPSCTASMTADAVLYLSKGMSAMETDEVRLFGDSSSISLEMIDINGDKLTFDIGDDVASEDPAATDISFSHKYPVKLLQTLFKSNHDTPFHISKRGMLRIAVNGLDVYVLPKA